MPVDFQIEVEADKSAVGRDDDQSRSVASQSRLYRRVASHTLTVMHL